MKYLIDENWSPSIAKALRVIFKQDHADIVCSRDNGWLGLDDVSWLSKLAGPEQWVVVSRDIKLNKRPAERIARTSSGAILLVCEPAWGNAKLHICASALIRWWPDLKDSVARHHPGAALRLPLDYEAGGLFPLS